MKKNMKKLAALTLAGTLAAASLAGCGSKKVELTAADYPTTSAGTVGGDTIYMSEFNYLLRQQQYGWESMFGSYYTGSNLWESAYSGTTTMQDYLKTAVMTSLVQTYVLDQHAESLGISLSDEDIAKVKAKVTSDAAQDADFLTLAGYNEELVTKIYTDNALANLVYQKLVEDVDTTVDESEYTHVKFDYLLLAAPVEETTAAGESKAEGESTAEATTAAETTAAETTTAAASDGSDYEDEADELLRQLTEGGSVDDLYTAQTSTYGDRLTKKDGTSVGQSDTENNDLNTFAFAMKTGDTGKVYVDGKGWYLIYCTDDDDEAGRKDAIDKEIESRKATLFTEKYAEITPNVEIKMDYETINAIDLSADAAYVAETTAAVTTTAAGTSGTETTEAEGTTAAN